MESQKVFAQTGGVLNLVNLLKPNEKKKDGLLPTTSSDRTAIIDILQVILTLSIGTGNKFCYDRYDICIDIYLIYVDIYIYIISLPILIHPNRE